VPEARVTQRKDYSCPCCGQPIDKPLGVDGKSIWLGPNQLALFNILKRHPGGITSEAIRERVFASSRKGIPYAKCDSIVAATANYTNKKIKAWGLKITSTKGPGSVYRLVRL
jgi:hypothetical protein